MILKNLVEDEVNEKFIINGTELTYSINRFPFKINSFPREYSVDVVNNLENYNKCLIDSDFIIIDKNIEIIYPLPIAINAFIYRVDAKEKNKTLNTAVEIIERFIDNNISKGSKVIAIGGGIIQDLCACACALFRRGQPFTYFPTTTLGQLDSCVGAKCAVNTEKAKNILGLFSAPKNVIIPTFMIKSMPKQDHLAGLSEMLRLCLTASENAVACFLDLLPDIKNPEEIKIKSYERALKLSLSIKKSVVDFDEYEKDIRRSMNYGHTFGHAIEKLVNFKIPHGLGVLLGIHMANKYSLIQKSMSKDTFEKVSLAVKEIILNSSLNLQYLKEIKSEKVVEQFKYDKKGDGSSVPLILIEKPGKMFFYKHFFNSNSEELLLSISSAIEDFIKWN